VELEPRVYGGRQEYGLRAGTENVAGIVGFGAACRLAGRALDGGEMERVVRLRDRLEAGLLEIVPEARINGDRQHRTPNTTNLTLPGIRGESLVLFLDRKGVFFSSGSACKSGNPDPSHVLLAAGLTPDEAHCSIRLSVGLGTTGDDIEYTLDAIRETLADTLSAIRFVPCR